MAKAGRPKNPTTVKLEREIRKLEEKIEKLEASESLSKDPKEFDGTGLAIDYDKEKKRYRLKVIKYDTMGTDAVVSEVRDAGDSGVRAMFEAKKFIAHYIDLIVQTN